MLLLCATMAVDFQITDFLTQNRLSSELNELFNSSQKELKDR